MDPIPTWVRRLWDMWDLRILVLLSFTLQIILSIFGARRKYISSLWLNSVLVWLAYLMADWVATVALGKLSDAQGNQEKSNVLWAIWAPLLLLHLGGPDSITAYSLEDNQLWMRHLMGLAVQLFVAIYVILISWKNSWFSFTSIPALVAGIIKYGERTWVLKSVRGDKYLDRIPFGSLKEKYPTEGHDYVRVLVVAREHLKNFMDYLESEGNRSAFSTERYRVQGYNDWFNMETNIFWDAVEVQIGLMYDLLYTKAIVIYSKGGFIMRCINFGCTVAVLVGLTIQIVVLKTREEDDDEESWHEIDIAITGVLTVGALALEIYAAIVIFSSNWGMLWLISQGKKEWVTWLSQRFPWLFYKKKNWSHTIGQFDLLGYCLKVGEPAHVQSRSRTIIRWVLGHNYEEMWNRYRHKTSCSVHPLVYNTILELGHTRQYLMESRYTRSGELEKLWGLAFYNEWDTVLGLVRCVHLATEICYHLEMEWDAGREDDPSGSDSSLWKQNKEVSKTLSDYMMYLVIMHPSHLPKKQMRPSLLPSVGSLRSLEMDLHDPKRLIGDARDVNSACRYLLSRETDEWSKIVKILKGLEKSLRWEMIKQMWLMTLGIGAKGNYGQKSSHFQQLRQGGELLTLIWFLNPRYEEVY